MNTRRIQFVLRASPSTPRDLAAQVADRMRDIIGRHEKARFDRAHLKTVDQNWIEYEIVYTMPDTDHTLHMDTQQAINLDAMQMFEELGVSTAPRPQHVMLQEAPEPRDVRGAEKPAANEDAPGGSRRFVKHRLTPINPH